MGQDYKYPDKIRYKYKVSNDCNTFLAHGVWGGVNAHGEIELNLYTESDELPTESEQVVHPDGSVGPEIPDLEEETRAVERVIRTKVILSYHTARALTEWLEDKMQILEQEGEGSPFLFDDDNSGPAQ